MSINYKELLKKYIAHIIDAEGYAFLDPGWQGEEFSDEEWAELVNLMDEKCE